MLIKKYLTNEWKCGKNIKWTGEINFEGIMDFKNIEHKEVLFTNHLYDDKADEEYILKWQI